MPIIYELAKGGALIIVAVLCMFTGLVAAAKGLPSRELLLSKSTFTVEFFYVLPNIIFLAYRQMYSAPRYQNHEKPAAQWTIAWTGIAAAAMLMIVAISPDIYWGDLLYLVLLASPLFLYCLASLRLYKTAVSPGSEEDRRQRSFENLIFVPALLFCIVNFSLGLLLHRRLGQTHVSVAKLFSLEDAAYLFGSWTVIALYYFSRVRGVLIYAVYPLVLVGIGLFAFFALAWTSAKFVALALMITFFLGFGEVAKQLYFLNKNPNYVTDPRGADFYLEGANWSGVVYPTLFLLSPALFPEMTFLPIILVVYTFVLFWLWLSPDQKRSFWALIFGLAVGYGTPVAFIFSIGFPTSFFTPPITDQSPLQTLLALIALVGFMAGLLRLSKDLFGLRLDSFIRNIWNRNLYSHSAACLFLLLAMSQLVCIVLTFAWLLLFAFPDTPADGSLTRSYYAARLTLVGVAVVVLSVLAVILTIFRPKKLSATILETARINEMNPIESPEGTKPAPAAPVRRYVGTAMLLISSGRLGVSWIAGLASALVVLKSSNFLLGALMAFVSMTLVTMSGFVMNDISDLDKDRLAGKKRPLASNQLLVSVAWRGVGTMLAIAVGLAYLAFGLTSALWIAATAVALFAYSPIARKWPLVKGLYTALLTMTPFLFAYDVVGFAIPATILGLLLAYIVFREAILDAIDLRGDVSAGIRTVAFYFGERLTLVIGWVGMFVVLLAAITVLDTNEGKAIMVIGLLFQIIATLMFYFRSPHSLGMTRVTLLFGVLAVSLAG